jgi:hypothetical protein
MSDLIKRAQQALEGRKAAGPALSKQSKDLMARAQAAIEGSARRAAPIEAKLPRGCDELVKLPVTCSARGTSYVAIAHRYGDVLRIVGNEKPLSGTAGGSGETRLPGQLAGQYRIEYNSWVCPLCSTGGGIWVCGCDSMDGAMHCLGTSRGRSYCACGRFEAIEYVEVDKSAFRGTTGGGSETTQSSIRAARLQSPPLKQVTHG